MRNCSAALGSFVLAIVLSLFCGPVPRARGARESSGTTNQDCPCKVKITCDIQKCIFTFDPATLAGLDEKGVKDLAAAAAKHCKDSVPCIEQFNLQYVEKNLEESFKSIKSGNRDADTFTTNAALKEIIVKCVDQRPNGKGGDVEVVLCAIAITLLPNNAGQMLKDHEIGHVTIQEHYLCKKFADVLKKKIEGVVCAKKYKDNKELEREARKLVGEIAKEFQEKVGKLSSYQGTYDINTSVGTVGNQAEEAKKITDAIDGKVQEAFP